MRTKFKVWGYEDIYIFKILLKIKYQTCLFFYLFACLTFISKVYSKQEYGQNAI